MELVSFVDPDDLSPAMRKLWEQSPRPGLRKFAQVMAHAERFHLMFAELNAAVRFENHLGNKLTELVRLTIAKTTRCPVCMAGRLPQAVAEGMTEEMVQALDFIISTDYPARGEYIGAV